MTDAVPPTAAPPLWADPGALAALLAPVHARMRAAVAGQRPEAAGLYHWLRYHLGWAEPDGTATQARSAKGIRPAVALVACAAVGASPDAAVDAAAAIELTHEFSLIHDDLEDGDALRRGRATLWAVVGAPQAINAGDALFALARGVLSGTQAPPATSLAMLRRYDAACLALAEGQYLDIAFESADSVTPAQYEAMVRGKTGALLGAAAALGACAGAAPPATIGALGRYGEAVGIAFQMQDDVLGLWGDPAHTGKPAGADLVRRKKSLPVVLALSHPDLAAPLGAYLRSAGPDPALAPVWAERLASAGVRATVTGAAQAWADRAQAQLTDLDLVAGPRAELVALAHAAVARTR